MKKLLLALIVLLGMFTAGFDVEASTEDPNEPDTAPVEETTTESALAPNEMTDEELQAFIEDTLGLALSLWDKVIAIAGVTSVGGMLTLFVVINKKFKLFGDDSEKVNRNAVALVQAVEHLTKEDKDMKKAMIAMINVANVDAYTKGEMIKLLDNDELTVADFTRLANNLAENAEQGKDTDTEETESLLTTLTKDNK